MDRLTIQRPRRWDQPLDPSMRAEDVEHLLTIAPFRDMDPERFPRPVSLLGILENDTRIVRYRNGDLIIREGDYGTSAYLILEGQVRVAIERLPDQVVGRRRPRKASFWKAAVRSLRRPRYPEVRRYHAGDGQAHTRGEGQQARIFLQDVPGVIDHTHTVRLDAGNLFGEIAALGRTERTATVFAEGDVRLLEIRWPGLRDFRKFDPAFKAHVDNLYRERSLFTHLKLTPLFAHLTDAQLTDVVEAATFETYGQFDWHLSYKQLVDRGAQERLAQEPVIVQQGDYVNGIVIVRSGFGRVSRIYGSTAYTLNYLAKGQIFGLEEVVHNWRHGEALPHQMTLRAVGYMDTLFIPTGMIERYVLGDDRAQPLADAALIPELPLTERGTVQYEAYQSGLPTEVMEQLVERRIINGTAAMFIDLDRCTRCDDCVKACAAAHDNNPRFVRHGPKVDDFMVANACMHCADPVCMIGCPTAAIHRDRATGQILINDATCVGCATCANSCPYDNIRMVEIRDATGRLMRDAESNQPLRKATKCDLCIDELDGPACQRACPHDALIRIDVKQGPEDLRAWLS